ncbi:hypothetical protein GA0115255_107876, partial [Streptomyces sp. Ncost-T6T-2b]
GSTDARIRTFRPTRFPRGGGTHRRQPADRHRRGGRRRRRADRRPAARTPGPGGRRGHRTDEGDRRGGPGGCERLSGPATAHGGCLLRRRVLPALPVAGRQLVAARGAFPLLPGGCAFLRGDRIHRHAARRPKQCAGGRSRAGGDSGGRRTGKGSHLRLAQSDEDRFPYRRCGRNDHGGTRTARGLLCGARLCRRRAQGAGGVRPRCGAHRHVHEGRWRDLHQGRGRGRRPGGQGGAGHPGGRSA